MLARSVGICVRAKEGISSAVFRVSGHTEEGNRTGHIRKKMILGSLNRNASEIWCSVQGRRCWDKLQSLSLAVRAQERRPTLLPEPCCWENGARPEQSTEALGFVASSVFLSIQLGREQSGMCLSASIWALTQESLKRVSAEPWQACGWRRGWKGREEHQKGEPGYPMMGLPIPQYCSMHFLKDPSKLTSGSLPGAAGGSGS